MPNRHQCAGAADAFGNHQHTHPGADGYRNARNRRTVYRRRALSHLNKGIVVCCRRNGQSVFSTDTTAALRAAEMEADVIFLAKKVNGVYDSDPTLNPNAKMYTQLTHMDVLEKDLKVMDSTAASLCRDNGILVHVFGLAEENSIMRACLGEDIGTVIR